MNTPLERAQFLKEHVFKELPLGVAKLILHYSQEPWGALWYTRQMDSLYRVQGSADAFLRAAASGDED